MNETEKPLVISLDGDEELLNRNPIVHFPGKSIFPGAYELTAEALKYYNQPRECFGSTEVILSETRSFNVKDLQYYVDDEDNVGMRLIPVNDLGSVIDPNGKTVPGAQLLDDLLRREMNLGDDDPIYALIAYCHPEQNKGTLPCLLEDTDKVEMGFTHLCAYIGEGQTTNSPALLHQHRFGVGPVKNLPYGYPGNVQIVSLKDVAQAVLNKNAQLVDTCLNHGVMFPYHYKESKFRAVDINTCLMYYRDWIKWEPYLRKDKTWYTYCAAHKTIVVTIMLNLPHNEPSFMETYGEDEGKDLFRLFKASYYKITGEEFEPEDETYFEPLWKKEGFSWEQISPFAIEEYYAYEKAKRERMLPVFKGKKPLKPTQATGWGPQSTAEIMYDFIQAYADFLDAGAITVCTIILAFMKTVEARMGITEFEYLYHALPIMQYTMIADARTNAPNDPDNYLHNTYIALCRSFGAPQGGSGDDRVDIQVEFEKVRKYRDSIEDFINDNPNVGPDLLALIALLGVVYDWEEIIKEGSIPAEQAYAQLMQSIQKDLEEAREIVETDPSKIQYNAPPAITHLISIGMYQSNPLVSVKEVCTVVDHSNLQLKA